MILLLGNKQDNLLRLIEERAKFDSATTLWLTPEILLNELVINDEVDASGRVSISWKFGDFQITLKNVTGVVNYLHFFESDLLKDFEDTDKDYVLREINSYFCFAISHFPNVVNKPTVGTISGFCQNMPWQWQLANQFSKDGIGESDRESGIGVPLAYYGSMYKVPPELRISPNTVISKSLYEGRNWLRTCGWPPISENVFCYERPQGDPLIVTCFDDYLYIDGLIDDAVKKVLKSFCESMLATFHLRLGQLLFFFDNESGKLTFGSISPQIDLSHVNRLELADRLVKNITGSLKEQICEVAV